MAAYLAVARAKLSGGGKVISTKSLNVDSSSKLDLDYSDLIVDYTSSSPLTPSPRARVRRARA